MLDLSKGLYDKCQQLVITPKGMEKRVDIEVMSFKQAFAASNGQVRWVHGDAQKPHEPWQLNVYVASGQKWRLVYDERFTSARRRRTEHVLPLEDMGKITDDD